MRADMGHNRRRAAVLTLATAAVLLAVAAPPAAGEDWVLRTTRSSPLPGCSLPAAPRQVAALGPAVVGAPTFRDASFTAFRRKIGPPARVVRTSPSSIRAHWGGRKAASLLFLTLGGSTRRGDLLLQTGGLTGRRWVTERGVRVGSTVRQIRRAYGGDAWKLPRSGDRTGTWWRLAAYCNPYGTPAEAGSIDARIVRGHVARLAVWIGAAGD